MGSIWTAEVAGPIRPWVSPYPAASPKAKTAPSDPSIQYPAFAAAGDGFAGPVVVVVVVPGPGGVVVVVVVPGSGGGGDPLP